MNKELLAREEILARIEHNNFWTFHGGIHPPEQKQLTSHKPIRNVCLPEQLIIPLQQHIGEAGKLLVEVGDTVLKGQALTQCVNAMAVPVHAPTSGKITAIKNSTIAHPSGLQELCLFLEPDGEDKWRKREICNDYTSLSKQEIIECIIQAGISGMGGAGFPTHIKVNTQSDINTLIINAAECEPYITADDLLMREHSCEVIDGINILDQLLSPELILIGIEDNKPEAIDALKKAAENFPKIKVCVIPTKYPSGGEKQLIQILTGQEVPKGALPNSIGIVMQNVATCFAIADAVIHDIPLIKRVVTVTGFALEKPQNVWALLGTPVGHLLSQCGYKNDNKKHVIMGGPMMGFSLPSPLVPVVKISNCILAPSEKEISSAHNQGKNEVECIRCGECASVCPSQLLPQELQWSAKAKDYPLLNDLNLFDCIECGACAYVCPSQIPLVNYYRVAKAEIRQQKLLDLKAEKAKARFEARKLRLEREKKAREEKHKKAAEARKARMNADTPQAKSEKSAVAAALARVKAKKAQQAAGATSSDSASQNSAANNSAEQTTETVNTTTEVSSEKQQVSDAIARAKAKKLARAAAQNIDKNSEQESKVEKDKSNENTAKTQEVHEIDEKGEKDAKKAKVAAAVAKAKAKKQAEKEQSEPAEQAQSSEPQDDKKARIAAAVAKAKAKKAAAKANTDTDTELPEISQDKNDDNSGEKSRKDAKNSTSSSENSSSNKSDEAQKQEVQHKKSSEPSAQAETSTETENSPKTETNTEAENNTESADDKKARIAAAVAKAKAKKIAKAKEKVRKNTIALNQTEKSQEQEQQTEAQHSEEQKAQSDEKQQELPLDAESSDNAKSSATTTTENSAQEKTPAELDKKARIAAAVAKAKAKKQSQKQLRSES